MVKLLLLTSPTEDVYNFASRTFTIRNIRQTKELDHNHEADRNWIKQTKEMDQGGIGIGSSRQRNWNKQTKKLDQACIGIGSS